MFFGCPATAVCVDTPGAPANVTVSLHFSVAPADQVAVNEQDLGYGVTRYDVVATHTGDETGGVAEKRYLVVSNGESGNIMFAFVDGQISAVSDNAALAVIDLDNVPAVAAK